jgi:hypothetical protein
VSTTEPEPAEEEGNSVANAGNVPDDGDDAQEPAAET